MTTASERTQHVHLLEAERIAIEQHLEQLIESSAFAGSRRSQAFLRYVVQETLAGRGHDIKERNIATDVFGKGADFNSQTESIVRVNALEVRKRLKAAYQSGLTAKHQIELPLGSYQPVFHEVIPEQAAVALPSGLPARGFPYRTLLVVAAICVLSAWGVVRYRLPSTPLDLLWQPFVHRPDPVLVSLPSPTVYELIHKEDWPALQAGAEVPASAIGKKENYYVGVGAAFGASRFAEQLASRQQAFFVKFGSDVAFADLQRSPAILLGAYSSIWSLEMTRNLRFRFEIDRDSDKIVDSQHPENHWSIPRVRNSSEATEGYAVVSRLMVSESGHPLLIAAGMTPNDTLAAAEFLTDARYFDLFAKSAGPDWSQKNFQVVLHNTFHGHSPGTPLIVASSVW